MRVLLNTRVIKAEMNHSAIRRQAPAFKLVFRATALTSNLLKSLRNQL